MNRENTGSMTTHIPTYYRPGYPNLVSPIFSTKSMSDHLTDHYCRSRVHSESKIKKINARNFDDVKACLTSSDMI